MLFLGEVSLLLLYYFFRQEIFWNNTTTLGYNETSQENSASLETKPYPNAA